MSVLLGLTFFVLSFVSVVGSAQAQANAGVQTGAGPTQPAPSGDLPPAGAPFRYLDLSKSHDVNVQFYLTAALAIAAGFDTRTAIDIGLYNQYVDDNPRTSPTRIFNFKARRDYHFTSDRRREKLWQKFLAAPSAESLGIYLHAFQDAYFHKGYGWFLGHFWKGERPDESWWPQNIAKADAMDPACYQKLVEAARIMGTGRAAIDYRQIAQEVGAFVRAGRDDSRGATFSLLIQRISAAQESSPDQAANALADIDQTMHAYVFQRNLNHLRIYITAFAPGAKPLLPGHQ